VSEHCDITNFFTESINWTDLGKVIDSRQDQSFLLHITELAKRPNLPYHHYETFSFMDFLRWLSNKEERAKPFLDEMEWGKTGRGKRAEEGSKVPKVITRLRAREEKNKKISPSTRKSGTEPRTSTRGEKKIKKPTPAPRHSTRLEESDAKKRRLRTSET